MKLQNVSGSVKVINISTNSTINAVNNYVLNVNEWIHIPISGSVDVKNDASSSVTFLNNRNILVDRSKLKDKYIISDVFYYPSSSVIHKPYENSTYIGSWLNTQTFFGNCVVSMSISSSVILTGSLVSGSKFTGSLRFGHSMSTYATSSFISGSLTGSAIQFQIN
jgi:hypothetical protein